MFNKEPSWYTVKLVSEIDEFDPDQYGNKWFNVLFEGDAETFMWLAKNEPEEGKKYYGHMEPTKSGKRFRFKTDKQPEGTQPGKFEPYKKDEKQITRNMVWKNLLGFYDAQSLNSKSPQWDDFWKAVDEHTDILLGTPPISLGDKFRSLKPEPYDPMLDLPPVDAYEEEQ